MYLILLARERGKLLGWSIGLFLFFFIIGISYSAVKDEASLDELWADLPESLREAFGGSGSITSPAGYLESQGSSLLPLVVGGALLAQATRRLSGAEQEGELDLVLSLPIRRSSYFWSLAAVGWTLALIWTLATMLGAVLGMSLGGAPASALPRLAYMILEPLPFILAIHAGALLVGAALHRRGAGLAIMSGLLATSFLLQIVGSLSNNIEWLQWLSPYALWLRGDPYNYDTYPAYLVMSFALSAILLPLAASAWDRKDLKG